MSSDASGSGAAQHQGRYIIERTLGRGGMATVYLARDGELDRLVALKVLSPHLAEEESFRARFLREARLTARLVHANVVQVYDVGEDERGPFIVMEYVEGETLAAELGRRRTFAPEEAVGLALQLCAGLEAAHAAGLVHRDIKPRNVLLRRDGVAKIVDFGIARAIDTTLHTEQGAILGTAAYLAPEQARGEPVTAAADLYALGIVLYELLTGRRPFAAETLPALVLEREQGLIVPPRARAAAIPPTLEDAVMHCLERRPEARPASAAALAEELSTAVSSASNEQALQSLSTRPTEVLPSTPTRRLRSVPSNWGRLPARLRSRRRGAALLASAIAAAAIIAIGLAFAGDGRDGSESPARPGPTVTEAPPPAATQEAPPPVAPQEAPPPATTQDAAASCAELEQRKRDLEEEQRAIDEQKRQTKDKAEREALQEQKRALEEQKRELDRQLKACR